MIQFFYSRPPEHGFSRRPADVIRIEIVRLSNPETGAATFHWCQFGQSVLEEIPQGEVPIENLMQAAEALGAKQKWKLRSVVDVV